MGDETHTQFISKFPYQLIKYVSFHCMNTCIYNAYDFFLKIFTKYFNIYIVTKYQCHIVIVRFKILNGDFCYNIIRL